VSTDFSDPLTAKIAGFLTEIGIEVIAARIAEETFLPGILVKNGSLLVDESKLAYPGDLLHEAGHIAVTPGALRTSLNGVVAESDEHIEALEAAAIAWSYAAAMHLGQVKNQLPGVWHSRGAGICNMRYVISHITYRRQFIESGKLIFTAPLGIDPRVVFHQGGYRGNAEALLLSFSLGVSPGVGLLQSAGITAAGALAAESGAQPYPAMLKWLRD
jgi:hypothetical protein